MSRRRLLLAVCALFFGGAASAQITAAQFYDLVLPKMRAMNTSLPVGYFGTGSGPGYFLTTQTVSWPLNFTGYSGTVSMSGQGFLSALSTAAAKDLLVNQDMRCFFFMGDKCQGAPVITTFSQSNIANSGKYFDYTSPYGPTGRTSVNASVINLGTPNETWFANYGVPGGMGAKQIVGGEQFNPECSGPVSSSIEAITYKTMDEAMSAISKTMANFTLNWFPRAPICVPFRSFVKNGPGVLADAVKGVEAARADKVLPTRFFTLSEPITFTDGGSAPGTGTGTPAPAPGDWSTAPVDEELQCSVINIPCNLRKLFVPQVDWQAEWAEMQDALGQRMPFGYLYWIRDGSSGASAQDVGIDICATHQFNDRFSFNLCETTGYQWWVTYGVKIMFASLYVGLLFSAWSRVTA